MTIGERIRYLRKDLLKLTQQYFGERIGLKKNSLSQIETGVNGASDTVILAICREFNISETWLRTGEGEISHPLTREAEIAQIAATLFTEEEESFRYRMIKALCAMDDEGWKYIERLAEEIVNKKKD